MCAGAVQFMRACCARMPSHDRGQCASLNVALFLLFVGRGGPFVCFCGGRLGGLLGTCVGLVRLLTFLAWSPWAGEGREEPLVNKTGLKHRTRLEHIMHVKGIWSLVFVFCFYLAYFT